MEQIIFFPRVQLTRENQVNKEIFSKFRPKSASGCVCLSSTFERTSVAGSKFFVPRGLTNRSKHTAFTTNQEDSQTYTGRMQC